MDFPGFHLDGGAITALLVLANTVVLVWSANKVKATHDAVNGMQAAKLTDAHVTGVVEGVKAALPIDPVA